MPKKKKISGGLVSVTSNYQAEHHQLSYPSFFTASEISFFSHPAVRKNFDPHAWCLKAWEQFKLYGHADLKSIEAGLIAKLKRAYRLRSKVVEKLDETNTPEERVELFNQYVRFDTSYKKIDNRLQIVELMLDQIENHGKVPEDYLSATSRSNLDEKVMFGETSEETQQEVYKNTLKEIKRVLNGLLADDPTHFQSREELLLAADRVRGKNDRTTYRYLNDKFGTEMPKDIPAFMDFIKKHVM